MATTTIPWGDGSGDNIYLTYSSASGDQTVEVSSDANTGSARTQTVTFTAGLIMQQLTVSQEAGVSLVPYIRNTSREAYINTGITPDQTTKIVIRARNFTPYIGALFGSQVAVGEKSFTIGTYGDTNIGRIRGDYASNASFYADDQYANLSWYHEYELYQGVIKVDGTTIASTTDTTFSNNYPIFLFGMNRGGTHVAPNVMDICSCKLYKGGVLVRDFTPVNSPSVGFYDAVSDTVFTNAGSGSLSYGTFNPDAFTQLEYLSCTNAQYIDTGIPGDASTRSIVKFQARGTSISYPNLFGTMRSGTSGTYFLLQLGNVNYKNRYANFYIDSTTNNQIYNNNSTKLTNLDVTFIRDGSSAKLVRNNANFGSPKTVSPGSSFTTSPDTMALCTIKSGGEYNTTGAFNGYIYFAQFRGVANRNFVPAKVNGVAGFYETYSDVFYPSVSGTPFVAGPELRIIT